MLSPSVRAEEGAEAVLALGGSLRKWHDQKHLMCCTRRGRAKGEEDSAPQIPSNHAYAIVDVRKQEAVLLRDPAAVRAPYEEAAPPRAHMDMDGHGHGPH